LEDSLSEEPDNIIREYLRRTRAAQDATNEKLDGAVRRLGDTA
jgi:hypothetical protein